jgi:UDP-2,3-diacylglucosamine pyrophosphatase LpxH
MTVIGLMATVLIFVYVADIPISNTADEWPQLLVADGAGKNGIPDMAVAFHTKDKVVGSMVLGIEGQSSAPIVIAENYARRAHVFLLNDLQPNTQYWYRVNNGQIYYFNTPPAEGPLHFAVFSDAHYGNPTASNDLSAQMLQYIADPSHDFRLLFSLGDLVDHGFNDENWQAAFQALSTITSKIPTRFTVGNHETIMNGLKKYEAYCYPKGMVLESGSRIWYRVDVGDIHFLVIDLEWSAESFTSEQAEWLETQLASISPDDWTVVMGHGFYYASGARTEGWNWYDNPETIGKLTLLFEEYHVDMVFSGHAHQLELLQKEGVTYVICGPFGGALESGREYISPASVWYSIESQSFVDVTIDGEEAVLVFRDSNSEEVNSFTITNR